MTDALTYLMYATAYAETRRAGAVRVTLTLQTTGVCVTAAVDGFAYNSIVSWETIDVCRVNPLTLAIDGCIELALCGP